MMDLRRRVLVNSLDDMPGISLVLNKGITYGVDTDIIYSIDVVNSSGKSLNINLSQYRLMSGSRNPIVTDIRYRLRDNNVIELTSMDSIAGLAAGISRSSGKSLPNVGTNILSFFDGGANSTSSDGYYKSGSILIDCNSMTVLRYSPLIYVDIGSRRFVIVYYQYEVKDYYYEVDSEFNILSKSSKNDSEIYSRIRNAFESLYSSLTQVYYSDFGQFTDRRGIFTGKLTNNSVRYLYATYVDSYKYNYNYRTVNLLTGDYTDEAVIYNSVNILSHSI